MATLHLVLIEPQIPQNTGNIARTCAATNAVLHLVGPMGFQPDDKKLKRAGLDYWHFLDIRTYESTDRFFAENSGPFFFFTTKGKRIYSDCAFPDGAYLVFGREDRGLQEEMLLQHEETCLRVPMREGARSLNLSNTVALATYEVLRQWGFPELVSKGQLHRYTWPEDKVLP